jgi:hypothetical protein
VGKGELGVELIADAPSSEPQVLANGGQGDRRLPGATPGLGHVATVLLGLLIGLSLQSLEITLGHDHKFPLA